MGTSVIVEVVVVVIVVEVVVVGKLTRCLVVVVIAGTVRGSDTLFALLLGLLLFLRDKVDDVDLIAHVFDGPVVGEFDNMIVGLNVGGFAISIISKFTSNVIFGAKDMVNVDGGNTCVVGN